MHASPLALGSAPTLSGSSHLYGDSIPSSSYPMRAPQRRSLHLSIDSSPYHDSAPSAASDSAPSPTLSTRASIATSSNTTYSALEPVEQSDEWRLCSVFCLYDFHSEDPDHLSFRKKDVLDIVQKQDSGWWAAMHRGRPRVGWIPAAFVQPLADELAETYGDVNDELRAWKPEARLSTASSFRRGSEFYADSRTDGDWHIEEEEPASQRVPPSSVALDTGPPLSAFSSDRLPESDITMLSSSRSIAPLLVNKPTPPTPISPSVHSDLFRRGSDTATNVLAPRNRWRADPNPSPRLPIVSEKASVSEPDMTEDEVVLRPPRSDKVRHFFGDENAQKYVDAKAAQSGSQWYLRPLYMDDELTSEADGTVKAGTLRALVERLTLDAINPQQEKSFRRIFFLTFRTFASADEVFSLLTARFETAPPENLTGAELDDWRDRRQRPVQNRVLTCFTTWLEDHGMLNEDPHIARRMQEFLSLISQPPPLALTAQLIMQSLERLTFSRTGDNSIVPTASKRKKVKMHKNDLLRMDVGIVAQHLTTLEWRLYARVKPQECLNWAKSQSSSSKLVSNLGAFCGTHEKVANWVKLSVLGNDGLGKRADTVDFWIRVAEKCRTFQNFSSMSAIVTGLSSAVVSRLHLTWAHVSRMSHLDPLSKLSDPTTKYAQLRKVLASVDGPCIPFLGMYLGDLVHINDQFPDVLSGNPPLINFSKRQNLTDAVTAILRHQAKPHLYPEDPQIMMFIEQQLSAASSRDVNQFWARSQELQQAELAHADIRKGLEAAGF